MKETEEIRLKIASMQEYPKINEKSKKMARATKGQVNQLLHDEAKARRYRSQKRIMRSKERYTLDMRPVESDSKEIQNKLVLNRIRREVR